jgi:CRISPR-associated endonuclease/helicase Cas3
MEALYRYWGKAQKPDSQEDGDTCHLLVYHSLDVAAVGRQWLNSSPVLVRRFVTMTGCKEKQALAWVLFFIAIHDLGKFDIRFQLKALTATQGLWKTLDLQLPDPIISREYWHGEYAVYWVYQDLGDRFSWKMGDPWDEPDGEDRWKTWLPWIRAVAGHHGMEPPDTYEPTGYPPQAAPEVIVQDRKARLAFVQAMETLFLEPAGLSLNNLPPPCDLEFLAGFCSVCDWLGSTTENHFEEIRFGFVSEVKNLDTYFKIRLEVASRILAESGLLGHAVTCGGMAAVFPQFSQPHQVQILVDDLPLGNGLTLIEAPTGSGKTEAALAYAARILAEGLAESIIFALPTQATADAMLSRLLEVAERLFNDTNVLLAHGKSRFNPRFIDLKTTAERRRLRNYREQEASVQCALWLSQSRKRVFLGQIGVCTVDQVLVSALPLRHRFVRSFGLGKSVLIIDEIHAYDAYMYGLLDKVLRHQKAMGGSAFLLSATLPLSLRQKLLESWEADGSVLDADDDYPLITQVMAEETSLHALPEKERQRLARQKPRKVRIEWQEIADMLPNNSLEQAINDAAREGANVVVICNLVADAQEMAQRLARCSNKEVLLFHSRYRFKDRQRIQEQVMSCWGKKEPRLHGGILVATQVIEQSLDLDFDWMISQLCPIDLLFQRLGRLHRHFRKRPVGFEHPSCTVLLPKGNQYELHKLIYGNGKAPNSRVLWRTEQMVRRYQDMHFPDVYRPLIERVYEEEPWPEEQKEIVEEYEQYWQAQYASRLNAQYISNIENSWNDDDSNVSLLTRDGEMSLNILPVVETALGRCFLDEDTPIGQLEEWQQAEQIMRNTLPAPKSWQRMGLPEPSASDGLIWLKMEPDGYGGWQYQSPEAGFEYTLKHGMRMEKS